MEAYIDNYYTWLREKTYIENSSATDWKLIHTPFIGAFNDTIEIYAQKSGDRLVLSDNGETFSNLELQGLQIQGSKKRKDILDTILLNYGIQKAQDELLIESDIANFPQAKHNLLSAILEINDLYVLATHNIASIFKEDVRNFLNSKNIIYTSDFMSKGTTGLEFNFDFQIAKKYSEIVIKSFNSINRSNLPAFLFAWDDIKPVRQRVSKKEVKAIAIINDNEREIKHEFLDALKSRNADYILWSKREEQKSLALLN